VHNGVGLITEPSDGSVSTAKIEDLAVTSGKLAADSVITAKILDDNVTTGKILDSNITYAKIQDTTTANRVIGAATAGVVSEVQVVDDMTNFVSTSSAAGLTIKGDGTTDGYVALNCDQNTHAIKLKSPPHSAAQTYTLTFPITAPATDKFIQTTSGGQLSFATVAEYDDDAIRDDIATLALHQATNENAAKYNLVNTNVDQYEDSTGIASLTDCVRDAGGEYVSTTVVTYDANTVLLLHYDDVACSDSSGNAVPTTLYGGMGRSSAESKFGGYSGLFDGSDDYLKTSDMTTTGNALVAVPTTGDFTVDFWFKYNTTTINTGRFYVVGSNGSPTSTGGIGANTAGYNASTVMNIEGPSATVNISGYPSIDLNWHHYAFMRSGTTVYQWYDGILKSSSYTGWNGIDMSQWENAIINGAASHSAIEYYNGYIDEFRYSNNARYSTSGNFTPETSAYASSSSAVNATGNYISTATTANASVSSIGAVITYKNLYGTNTLNTDITLEVSANGGSNYSTCVLTAGGTFSTGILQASAPSLAVTAGTSIQYRLSFANQLATSKEAQIYGISLMY
jgi:hypothetical protein